MGALENGPLDGVADVNGQVLGGAGEKDDAFDEVGDVAEASGLGAFAVDRERISTKGLDHKVGDDPAIVGLQAGAVGIEYPHHVGIDAVIAMVGGDGGLGKTFGLVIDRTRTDWVDMTPVGLDLGMDFGVTVAFGCGGVKITSVVLAGKIKGIEGAGRTYQEGFDAQAGVVDRTGGRGEVEDVVDGARIEWLADIVLDEAEAGLVGEMGEIGMVAGREVVEADDGVAFGEQRVTKMRA